MLTQDQIAQQMIAQLRVLDPSVSAEVGTPERKIIDTVAQSIAEAGVDLNVVGGSLDLESKYGSDLDAYVGLFGFGRQSGARATGFVTFSRVTPSPYNITIPKGTQVAAQTSTGTITFQTTDLVTLVAGATEVIAPILALLAGSQGNVAANTITQFANAGAPPLGVTAVTNENPTTGGADQESDVELKVRFKNTVFRNMAGTEDQYMALALSTQYSTKANVVGPISRYQEYVQVPAGDDTQVTVDGSGGINLPGVAGTFGSADTTFGGSDIFAYNQNTNQNYIQGGGYPGSVGTFGDSGTYFGSVGGTFGGSNPAGSTGPLIFQITGNGWTTAPSNNPYAKYIYTNTPFFMSNGGTGDGTLFYNAGVDFLMNVPPADLGDTYRELAQGDITSLNPNTPNFTLYNVYTGTDTTVQLPRPNDVVLVEYSYLSAQSRNDINRNILNCVDVYVNGENPLTGDAVLPTPQPGINIFTNNPIDSLYFDNFRRFGQPLTYPIVGHLFQPLFLQPVIGLPDQITIGSYTFFKNQHYWLVQDYTLLGDTVRTRNGIEWDPLLASKAVGDPDAGPFTGPGITTTGEKFFTVSGYTYDRNIIDLQTALEGAKQVTTDVLAHRSRRRYFKLDLTVVYSPGNLPSAINPAIQASVQNYFDNQYFGTVILLSDLLLAVLQTPGVSNVRWTQDVLHPSQLVNYPIPPHRIVECDIYGNRLAQLAFFDTDFWLNDNELPTLPTGKVTGDTLEGLILRPRAENTFQLV